MPGLANTQSDTYFRIASISIALYDYILTLPAEWRLYRSQSSITRLSVACILFILIRYMSILTLIASNYGWFATSFTQESCSRVYMIAPVLKVVQTMISQVILGVRTVNIARRRSWVKWVMITAFAITTMLEWFTNLFHRDPLTRNGNCWAGNSGPHLSVWIFHLLSMMYDLVAMTISTVFLFNMNIQDKRLSRLPKIMFYDGLGYFVVLTATNTVNMVFYLKSRPVLQSSAANLGYAMVWIMSQRILIHLRELATESNTPDGIIISRNLESSRAVQVHVEQTFSVEYDPYELKSGHLPKPSLSWDSRP
ncbi:hypothetical protein PILCRDRAFT_812483 [Piloderma croceum F 1598]|uniref:DUF6533 domain-containing protein n=1 Tax=Piloderma croceum (strain F 1598) TaxID=765440 RepID=A0A0C3G0G0_PILCF|nr:hypothetical protein PILCRDRAFT_812483 [Piloderma croceum F 1598]